MTLTDRLRNFFDGLSPYEMELERQKFRKGIRELPTGWIDIEDDLPMFLVGDFEKGYSEYKVKFKDGTEGYTVVSDHNSWYYEAKNSNITHWYNE